MKTGGRKLPRYAAGILATLLFANAAYPTTAMASGIGLIDTTELLDIHAEADESSAIAGQVMDKGHVAILGRADGWVKIKAGDIIGWIPEANLTETAVSNEEAVEANQEMFAEIAEKVMETMQETEADEAEANEAEADEMETNEAETDDPESDENESDEAKAAEEKSIETKAGEAKAMEVEEAAETVNAEAVVEAEVNAEVEVNAEAAVEAFAEIEENLFDESAADLKEEAEAQRKAAEAEAQAEARRKAAEAEAQAEAQRKAAEAEAQRKAAEAEAQAEAQKKAAEAEAQAEAQRKAAEAEMQAESQKKEAEAEAQAEAQRKAAEAEMQAEAQRKAAEAEMQAETQRKAAEATAQAAAHAQAATAGGMQISDEEMYLLANIIYCEAGCEPYIGKVAVANVVLNRVASDKQPNTITEVVYAKKQFSPVSNGSLKKALRNGSADESCYQAARDALAGSRPVGDKLFFRRVNGRSGQVIGHHVFY